MKKRILCMLISLVMLAGVCPTVGTVSADGVDYSEYDLTRYDVGKYVTPIWEGNVVVNECVYPITAPDGSYAPFKLTYPATQILSVKNYQLSTTYVAGRDYRLNADGDLEILAGGSITMINYRSIHLLSTPAGYNTQTEQYPYYPHRQAAGIEYPGWEFWEESAKLSQQTICVTYVHEPDDYLGRPEPMGDALPRTMSRLENGQSVKVVTCGDSVTGGAMASGYLGMSPLAPAYPQMTVDALKWKFNNPNVTLDNSGIGGSISEWDADLLNRTIINKNPDLVTMCYGMNDSSYSRVGLTDQQFYTNMKGRIDYIKSHLPNCEILLVSSVHGNFYTFPREKYHSHAQILHQLADEYAGQGVGVCDPQAIEDLMLTRKVFIDLMADNMVHPNDFGMRLITQTILDCLRYGTIDEIAESAVRKVRNATSAARGKEARYEELLEEARAAFAALGNEQAINAAIPGRIAIIENEMRYCAEGYHDFEAQHTDPLCGVDGSDFERCVYCGFEQNVTPIAAIPGDHVFTAWETTATATEMNDGSERRVCVKCGTVEERTVPATSPVTPNKALYADFGYNYMDTTKGSIKPFTTCGTVVFDVTPVDVKARSTPAGPCYVGAWIGSGYTILAGYDFDLQAFIIAPNPGMTYPQSATSFYAKVPFPWAKTEGGTFERHRLAFVVKGNNVKIYCDGVKKVDSTNSAYSATSGNVVLLYTKGEFALDDFIISGDQTFDPVTEAGGIWWTDDFENGMSHFTASWVLGGYTTVNVDDFTDRGHFPASHTHTNTLVASHAKTCLSRSFDEYECSACGERNIVWGTEECAGRHIFMLPTENGGAFEYRCRVCGEVVTEPVTAAGATVRTVGDVDGDRSINAVDVQLTMRYIVGYSDAECDAAYADFDASGRINARDVLIMMMYIVDGTLPAGVLR